MLMLNKFFMICSFKNYVVFYLINIAKIRNNLLHCIYNRTENMCLLFR